MNLPMSPFRCLTNYKQSLTALLSKGKDNTEAHPPTSKRPRLILTPATPVEGTCGARTTTKQTPPLLRHLVELRHPLRQLREMGARLMLHTGLPRTRPCLLRLPTLSLVPRTSHIQYNIQYHGIHQLVLRGRARRHGCTSTLAHDTGRQANTCDIGQPGTTATECRHYSGTNTWGQHLADNWRSPWATPSAIPRTTTSHP